MQLSALLAVPPFPHGIDDDTVAQWVRVGDHPLLASLPDRSRIIESAARLVAYSMNGAPLGPATDEVLGVLHELLALGLAVDRNRDLLLSITGTDEGSVVAADAVDEAAHGGRPRDTAALVRFVEHQRGVLETLPGWSHGGDGFTTALTELGTGLVQASTMRRFDSSSALAEALREVTEGAWIPVWLRAVAIVTNDPLRTSNPAEIDLIERLAMGALSLARTLAQLRTEAGRERAATALGHRFMLSPQVLALEDAQLGRALAACWALELSDLAQAVDEVDRGTPLPAAIRRLVVGTIELLGPLQFSLPPLERAKRTEMMDELRTEARRSGEISADERALLRRMDHHLAAFDALVERIERGPRNDFQEFAALRAARLRILDDLFRTALSDQQITDQERHLLVRAMELVATLR